LRILIYLMKWKKLMRKVYRIVEIKDGKVKPLFHGISGRREFPLDRWVKADKKIVRDGSNEFRYLSGFHFLPTKEEAEHFFNTMFRIKENRFIIPCYVRGNIRLKRENKKSRNAWLADEIYISSDCIT
jgi:hypothetical protein